MQEHDQYYTGTPAHNAAYDPLKPYATPLMPSRPVITISDPPVNLLQGVGSFSFTRDLRGGGAVAGDLNVYYSLGGSLSYDNGDYTLDPPPPLQTQTQDGYPRMLIATIPSGQDSITINVELSENALAQGAKTLVVALTPYSAGVLPQVPVSAAGMWSYVLDWNYNRTTLTFEVDNPLKVPLVGTRYMNIISAIDRRVVLELGVVTNTSNTVWPFAGNLPPTTKFQILVDEKDPDHPVHPWSAQQVGFKQRPLYQDYVQRSDIRVEKSLYLVSDSPDANIQVHRNSVIEVRNLDHTLWGSNVKFTAMNAVRRYSPAIHVNQDGYLPGSSFPKKAKVGYYLGSGAQGGQSELQLTLPLNFFLVNSAGSDVYQGSLAPRPDSGWNTGEEQYQHVLEADFTGFTTPGTYRLRVPGLGRSFAFTITDGAALKWARTYALGLYHQRCGNGVNAAVNALPFTRFTHGDCHLQQAYIPNMNTAPKWPDDISVNYHNSVMDEVSNASDRWPGQTAQRLYNFNQSLYPFANIAGDPNSKITKDVSGGHHDAGDYSKYVSNSGLLIHMLVFAADNIPGAGALNNLGIPESGNIENGGPVSDLLDEAKWEADFLLKMQDPDGGFYFLVYPICVDGACSRYEGFTPDRGPRQLLYPKTSCVTASSVAALAEIGSSPEFMRRFPSRAGDYRTAALNGWNFLLNKLQGSSYPYADKYQRITHYGDKYLHRDELAWAAAAVFMAFAPINSTVAADAHQKFLAWLPNPVPGDQGPLFGGWGCAVRDYAFAARSERPLGAFNLDSTTLGHCEDTILDQAALWRDWSLINSYGVSLADALKRGYNPRWFFPDCDAAYDIVVTDRLMLQIHTENPSDPRYTDLKHTQNLTAILENFNYQHGCNPLNLSFVTGCGWKRQQVIVHQYANYPSYDARFLPPSGVPLGSMSFRTEDPGGCANIDPIYWPLSGTCIGCQQSCDPDNAMPCVGSCSFALYDRWGDYHNVNREFVTFQTARALAAAAYMHSLSGAANNSWRKAEGIISFPDPLGSPTTVRLDLLNPDPTIDLNQAQIVWDVEGEAQPAFGRTFTIKPRTTIGETLVEAEAVLPDGRRVFGRQYIEINDPVKGGVNYPWPDPTSHTVALYHFDDAIFPPFRDSTAPPSYDLWPYGFVKSHPNTSWMEAPSGFAAQFGGLGDYITNSTTPIAYGDINPLAAGLSIEFRMYIKRLPDTGSAVYLFRFAQGDAPANVSEWSIKYHLGSAAFPQFLGPRGQVIVGPAAWSARMTPNTWHLVKITFRPSGIGSTGTTSVFVDDMSTAAASQPTDPYFDVNFGFNLSMGDFVGCIDELRISNTVR